ncbi:MAG: hypothetical protein PUE08_00395 [Eubacteriales bacterium]|nr:hypothetical protein [Eubacteriales bacterium]
MKKVLSIIAVIIVLVCIAVPVEHFYGDNIYALFAFSKSDVVQVSENVYKVPKDNPEKFQEYMLSNGWEFTDQLGTTAVYEKDGTKAYCDVDFKEFYAQYTVTYENQNDE